MTQVSGGVQQCNSWLGAPDQPQSLPHWLHISDSGDGVAIMQRSLTALTTKESLSARAPGDCINCMPLHGITALGMQQGRRGAFLVEGRTVPRCLENHHQRLLCLHLLPRSVGLAELMLDFLLLYCCCCWELHSLTYSSCWDCSLKLAVINNYCCLRRFPTYYIVVISVAIIRARLDVYKRYY